MHKAIRFHEFGGAEVHSRQLPVTVPCNDEMETEVKRLEAQMRAINAGHPEWANACAICGCELTVQSP